MEILQIFTSCDTNECKSFKKAFSAGKVCVLEKSGSTPEGITNLASSVAASCLNLQIIGLMTIGKYDNYDEQIGVNPDFACLKECRQRVADVLGREVRDLELSMGMSGDFQHAIEVGSSSVRVGQKIFGPRDYSLMRKFQNST